MWLCWSIFMVWKIAANFCMANFYFTFLWSDCETCEIFEKFNNDLYLWKSGVKHLKKAKYSILASILDIFENIFLTEPRIYFYNTLCKSHGFLISCFESYWKHNSKNLTFWKISFCHSFLNKIYIEQFIH